ncbi:hypothetical protein [Kitasatospora griseola]|uniref:hypothetical protein n=1 Tax=Kitasatospora griseola TaxID=2064 RepID=UPI0038280564
MRELDELMNADAPAWPELREALAATSRRPVPMRELLGIAGDFAQQAGLPDPGFLGDV